MKRLTQEQIEKKDRKIFKQIKDIIDRTDDDAKSIALALDDIAGLLKY